MAPTLRLRSGLRLSQGRLSRFRAKARFVDFVAERGHEWPLFHGSARESKSSDKNVRPTRPVVPPTGLRTGRPTRPMVPTSRKCGREMGTRHARAGSQHRSIGSQLPFSSSSSLCRPCRLNAAMNGRSSTVVSDRIKIVGECPFYLAQGRPTTRALPIVCGSHPSTARSAWLGASAKSGQAFSQEQCEMGHPRMLKRGLTGQDGCRFIKSGHYMRLYSRQPCWPVAR